MRLQGRIGRVRGRPLASKRQINTKIRSFRPNLFIFRQTLTYPHNVNERIQHLDVQYVAAFSHSRGGVYPHPNSCGVFTLILGRRYGEITLILVRRCEGGDKPHPYCRCVQLVSYQRIANVIPLLGRVSPLFQPRYLSIILLWLSSEEVIGGKDTATLRQPTEVIGADISVLYLLPSRPTHG